MAATYSLSIIAKLLMLTERRVNQLTQEGVIPKVERGKYDLVASVQGYIRYLKERSLGSGLADDEYEHKKRLLKARADLAEMEAAQLSSQLIRAEVAEKVWVDVCARFRQKALSVPPKAAPLVAVETDASICYEIIESFLYEALAELAATEIISTDDYLSEPSESISDISATPEIEDFGMGGSEQEIV